MLKRRKKRSYFIDVPLFGHGENTARNNDSVLVLWWDENGLPPPVTGKNLCPGNSLSKWRLSHLTVVSWLPQGKRWNLPREKKNPSWGRIVCTIQKKKKKKFSSVRFKIASVWWWLRASVDVKRHWTKAWAVRELCESRGGRPGLPVLNRPYGLCGRKSGAGIAQWLEHRTRDWKVAGSNPCWNGGRIFFSRVDFLCWLLFRYPFHPRVTTVARKKSRSFCQKCRWQVTAKHAYTLRMWLLLNRASALVTTCP